MASNNIGKLTVELNTEMLKLLDEQFSFYSNKLIELEHKIQRHESLIKLLQKQRSK